MKGLFCKTGRALAFWVLDCSWFSVVEVVFLLSPWKTAVLENVVQ